VGGRGREGFPQRPLDLRPGPFGSPRAPVHQPRPPSNPFWVDIKVRRNPPCPGGSRPSWQLPHPQEHLGRPQTAPLENRVPWTDSFRAREDRSLPGKPEATYSLNAAFFGFLWCHGRRIKPILIESLFAAVAIKRPVKPETPAGLNRRAPARGLPDCHRAKQHRAKGPGRGFRGGAGPQGGFH